jgi:hypothetical protein
MNNESCHCGRPKATVEDAQREIVKVARSLEWLYRNAFLRHPIGTRAGRLARRMRRIARELDGREFSEIRPLVEEARAIVVMQQHLWRAEKRTWDIFDELFLETGAKVLGDILTPALERWNEEFPEIASTPEPRNGMPPILVEEVTA